MINGEARSLPNPVRPAQRKKAAVARDTDDYVEIESTLPVEAKVVLKAAGTSIDDILITPILVKPKKGLGDSAPLPTDDDGRGRKYERRPPPSPLAESDSKKQYNSGRGSNLHIKIALDGFKYCEVETIDSTRYCSCASVLL
jgi:hypothetical protein